MKIYILIILTIAMIHGVDIQIDKDLTEKINTVILEVAKIKKGMVRSDLDKYFKQEGGIGLRIQRQYVARVCPYIKVEVKFVFSEDVNNPYIELGTDVIESVGLPILQLSISD